ncbi:hypothetical protein D5086_007968 [Populus alba]|uniref:Uncharacterized protein n=1 Tax=Populus alba TaxID=43335 RepID=A0ACC4CFQ8_POPAL
MRPETLQIKAISVDPGGENLFEMASRSSYSGLPSNLSYKLKRLELPLFSTPPISYGSALIGRKVIHC